MKILLVLPLILTPIIRLTVILGSMRLRFDMCEKLEVDMGCIVPVTSKLLNMIWDIIGGNYPKQLHHKASDVFFAAVRGALKILWLIFLSFLPWNWKNETRN